MRSNPTLKRGDTAFSILVIAIILAALTVAFIRMASSHFLPCEYECGETLIAEFDARNVRLLGPRYGFVEDLATSPVPDAHPQYYTHNVNLGGLTYIALDALGLDFPMKQSVMLLIWALGLFYAYLCVAHFSKSLLCGAIIALLLATDFPFSHSYSSHALRTWQWLPLFGLPYHAHRFLVGRKLTDVLAITALFTIAFGVGYDFWIIMLAVAGLFFVYVAIAHTEIEIKTLIKSGAVIVGIAFIPFLLRQAHIILVLGWEYWRVDFVSTIAIKIPFVSQIIRVPSIADLDAWYAGHNVMRPPAAPVTTEGFRNFLRTAQQSLLHVTLPSAGLVTAVTTFFTALIGLWALLVMVIHRISGAPRVALDATIDVQGLCIYISCMILAIMLGVAVTPTVAVLYLLYNPPLVVAPLFAAKALLIGISLAAAWRMFVRQRYIIATIFVACASSLFIDHLVVSFSAKKHIKPMDVSWLPEIQARQSATFAVSYIGQAVAAFTSNWAVHVGGPGLAHTYFPKILNGQQPLTEMTFSFLESVTSTRLITHGLITGSTLRWTDVFICSIRNRSVELITPLHF